ncbi:2,3-dihydroxybenzoate-AMP ligase [Actinophytocola xinjiangensis]|uniref:2,3-dihydroxybenzoate-AMP ligase n=1 Tax=Actinophytocola xinjiangensis TaxID=485602 RepID=A0A7Z1AX72_9PSEU|nr:AMP-binding protein [Actinophytocola xinjiangensis]OLF09805.1 2,3-dihydroxybenzoate-AMP ligase [Actinophytocola xinjiangensis]
MSAPLEGFTPWPAEFAERYRAQGFWRGESLGALSRRWARRFGEAIAVVEGERRISYRDLDRLAEVRAAGLAGLGIGARDRVLVQLPNVAEFVVVFLALVRLGAVPVLTLPAHRRSELTHLAALSGAVAFVTADVVDGFDHRELAREVLAAAPSVRHVLVAGEPGPFTALADVVGDPAPGEDPAAGEVAVLLVSGGTTGKPKLIPRTHDDYAYNARASARVCGLGAEDVYLACLPIAHNFPLACPGMLGTFGVGGTVVMCPAPSPEVVFGLVARERVTVTALVPPLARMLADEAPWHDTDRSSVRLLQVGGAKLDADLARAIPRVLGWPVQQVFGMAEGLLNYTRLTDPDDLVTGSQGRPLSAADEIRVLAPDGTPVPDGEIGELWTRGPYTHRGYYRAAAHNATVFDADGFFRTGDLVRRLPTGHLVVEGRAKDVVNRGGENVSAAELEEHLLTHPALAQAAVIGLPDETLGELVAAVVTLAPDQRAPKLKQLKAFLLDRGLARFMHPDRLIVTDRMPLTAVGKIDKRALVTSHDPREGTPR